MKRGAWILVGAAASASACTTVFGEFIFEGGGDAGAGAATSGSSSSSSSSSTTSSGGVVDAGDAAACQGDASACASGCADLQTDQHNCGRCGHDCMYGMCMAGLCQPWPVAMNADVQTNGGTGLTVSNQIGADGTYVIWSDSSGSVHQVTAGGSAVVTVGHSAATGPEDGPVLGSGTVAFVGAGSSSVYTVSEGKTSATAQATIGASSYTANSLAVDQSATIAFLSGQDTAPPNQYHLLRCPLSGTTCAPLSYQSGTPLLRLLVNDNYAFWGASVLTRLNFTTSFSDTVGTGGVQALTTDNANVYWATTGAPATIYWLKQSYPSGATPQMLASNPIPIVGLAGDGTNVYFGSFDTSGNASLYYVPVAGGSATAMYTSQSFSIFGTAEGYVVAAGGAVYWADVGLGTPPTSSIMGIAAP